MKRLLLLFLLCPALLYSQNNNFFDFIKTINWDSNEDKIIENYRDNLRRRSTTYHDKTNNTRIDWEIPNIYIGEYPLTTYFSIDESSSKLIAVGFSLSNEISKKISYKDLTQIMDSLLIAKLGRPDKEEIDNSSRNQTWYKQDIIIDVSHLNYADINLYSIEVKGSDLDTNFRNSRWGDSKAQVLEIEKHEDKAGIPDAYLFSDRINGLDCDVAFIFSDDKLSMAKYIFKIKHTNQNDYIEDFQSMVTLLKEKYGEPTWNNQTWKNSLYKNDSEKYGFAISLGHLEYSTGWFQDKTNIGIYLNGDDHNTSFFIQYVSKKHEQNMNQKNKDRDINKL